MPSKTIKKASSDKRKAPQGTRTIGTISRSVLVSPAEEDLFARAFRASPHPIGVTELDSGCCLEINDAYLEIFGFQRHEVIGKTTLLSGIWPDPRERARFIDRLKAEGSVRNLEVSMRMKNGNLRQFLISADLIEIQGKQYLLMIGDDITERKQAEAERQKFVSLADQSIEFIGMCDLDFKPFYVNEAGRRLVGLDSLEQACAVRVQDYFFPEDQPMIIGEFFPGVLRQGYGEVVVRFRHFKTGEALWMIYNVFQVRDENGRVAGYATVSRDITEHKRAVEALRRAHEELEYRVAERTAELGRSNERLKAEIAEREQVEALLRKQEQEFRFLADNVPAYFSYIDTELRYRFVNKLYEELFGRPLVELTGQYVKDVVGESNFRVIEPHLREALAGRETSFLYPKVLPNGDASWMNVHYAPDRDEAGRVRGVLALTIDVTVQKRTELALRQNQLVLQEQREELQRLTEQLFKAQDDERRRIARDLHDDFGQRLVALTLDVAVLERHPPLLPELVSKALEPVHEELMQLSDDLRRSAHRLHPSLLKHAGLRAALEEYIDQAMRRTDLHITLKAGELPDSLTLDRATCLFRVCQESLQNVAKHAHATEVLVKLSGWSKGIGLSVLDNGTGFAVHDKSNHRKGLGLNSMQERLRLLNGFLNIHSRSGHGTKVCAWIPCQEGHRDPSSHPHGG